MEAKKYATNNLWVTEEIKEEIKKYLETKKMKTQHKIYETQQKEFQEGSL